MKPTLTTHDTEAAPLTTPGDIRRALAARADAEVRAPRGAWTAGLVLTAYAVGLLALVAGLAWLIERLPPGLGATLVAAVATWGVVVAVLEGGKPR